MILREFLLRNYCIELVANSSKVLRERLMETARKTQAF
jgi:hypothetical protein